MVTAEGKVFPNYKEVLLLLGAGVFLTASIIMPGLPLAVKIFLPKPWQKYHRSRLRRTVKKLVDRELVSITEIDDEVIIKLTKAGEEKVLRYKVDDLKLSRPKKWDCRWRIVMFDIPNKKKVARETLRRKLKELNFVALQKSVFLTPYPCDDEIEFLRQNLDIGSHVLMLEASQIENEQSFRNYFGV